MRHSGLWGGIICFTFIKDGPVYRKEGNKGSIETPFLCNTSHGLEQFNPCTFLAYPIQGHGESRAIHLLGLTSLGISGSRFFFGSQTQTNTAASLRAKNGSNSFISKKMFSVAALPGFTIKFDI